ncbi:MAG: hypothetical protein H7838_07345 [Magnetococcus sp. DMHC-8]
MITTTTAIMESGMTFGPYPAGHCWHIEKSRVYASNQQGVKMAEFLLLRDNAIWIVEAKSSSPRPEGRQSFDRFLHEMQQVMHNALWLFLGVRLGRHGPEALGDLPVAFQSVNLATIGFKLVLVINGHKPEWLLRLRNSLACRLMANMRALGLQESTIFVLNDAMARQKGLIQ